MKATEQFFLVVLFIMLYKTGTEFWTIQIKEPEQFFF